MKKCTKCKVEKNESEFGKCKRSKDGLKWWCKKCCNQNSIKLRQKKYETDPEFREKEKLRNRKKAAKWRKKNPELRKQMEAERLAMLKNGRKKLKEEMIRYLGGECSGCGYKKCFSAIDLHHKNANLKEYNISQRINKTGRVLAIEELKPEIDKCILLCKNCHTEYHDKNGYNH